VNALITLNAQIIGNRKQAPLSGELGCTSVLQSHPVDALRRTASKSYLRLATSILDPVSHLDSNSRISVTRDGEVVGSTAAQTALPEQLSSSSIDRCFGRVR
jgi:hypothetical protein